MHNTYTTQTLFNNTLSLYATQAWVTSQNYLSSAVMSHYLPLTGGIITDSGYNNTPLKMYFTANGTAYSYSQDYVSITTTGGTYGRSLAGEIQQMEGGCFILNTINNSVTKTYIMVISTILYIYTDTT